MLEAKEPVNHEPLLIVKDLSVDFEMSGQAAAAVRQVSYTIRRGEVLAIVGESGSGKSVSSMAILGLLPPNVRIDGSIEFNGTNLLALDSDAMRQLRGEKIAMIFQEPMTALDPVYTIGEQIIEAIRAHTKMGKGPAHHRAIELLKLVRLPEPERRIDHYPHQLSGGQLQRVVIAMAVSCDPDLLIADEPTTALDVTVQAEILELLRDLGARLNASVLFITHDMGVVADLADRVIVMREGRVVEEALVKDLFVTPKAEYTQQLLDAVPHLGQPGDEEPSRFENPDSSSITRATSVVLSFENIEITYAGRQGSDAFKAIDDVTIGVNEGEVVGLVGESGSGKSTLGRCAMGLLKPSAGRVAVCGTDITKLSSRQLRPKRHEFSMVFQDPASSLNPRQTLGDIVAKPLKLHARMNAKEVQNRVKEMLDQVKVPASWIERYPHELSGGQRQRVGIARALVLSPRLLIADEPTSALDVSVQATILDLLKELQSNLGFSCLFITHDLGVVEELADRIAVLKAGRLIEFGDATEVLHHSREEYTRRLVLSAPVPDPVEQQKRREAFAALSSQ